MSISGTQISIAFWANAETTSGLRGLFNYNYNGGYRGRINEATPQVLVNQIGQIIPATYTGSLTIPTSNWVHYVYSFDNTTREVKVYINGVLDIEQISSNNFDLTAEYIQIGKSWTDKELFDGRIDEFMVYNKVLNQTEVSDLYSYSD
jgi:hypothetical protein